MAESTLAVLRKKEGRGKFLTTVLILQALYGLFLLYIDFQVTVSDINKMLLQVSHNRDIYSFLILFSLVLPFMLIVILIGIWKWKKLAVYAAFIVLLYFLIEFFSYELPHIINNPLNTNESLIKIFSSTLFVYILEVLLYVWAIKRKWHLFS